MRSIKPDFFLHEGLADLSPLHRLVFIGLWTLADSEGRLEDRPKRIKAALLPWEDCDAGALLADLDASGFIHRYEVLGIKCIAIPAFGKHQRPHPKEPALGLPNPPERPKNTASREKTRQEIKPPDPIPSRPAFNSVEVEVEALVGTRAAAPSATRPPTSGKTTSTDGEDDDPPDPLQDRMDELFRKARGRPHEWPADPYPVLRAIGDKCADPAEVLRRLSNALTYARFPRYVKPADLVRHWEHYAEPDPANAPKASASNADKDWSRPVESYIDEHGNERLA